MNKGSYTPPTLNVDSVIFQLHASQLEVLLVQRRYEPFKGSQALPGGYAVAGETTQQSMSRILQAKAGLQTADLPLIEQLYTFDTIASDPRGHAVSVTYMGLGKELVLTASDTTQQSHFTALGQLPELAFDHTAIINYAHERLKSKLTYTNTIFALLPKNFTMSQLQSGYEAILGRQLDKRNFRKKFLSLDLILATDKILQDGAHRPARLYRFNKQSLQTLSRNFD